MTQIPIPNGNYQLFVFLKAWQTFGLNDWNICQDLQNWSHCSNQNLYAQVIDDTTSHTLVSCSTLDRDIKLSSLNGRTCQASKLIGEKIAKLSLEKNITQIVFDRGRYLYHGRIQALADGARSGGLQF